MGGHFNGVIPKWSEENPTGTKHGKHLGDLCFNIWGNGDNIAFGECETNKISLIPNKLNCILDRSLVIHENEDDEGCLNTENKPGKSWITGNAGNRIACAKIQSITYEKLKELRNNCRYGYE